jgi:hypothetical protein
MHNMVGRVFAYMDAGTQREQERKRATRHVGLKPDLHMGILCALIYCVTPSAIAETNSPNLEEALSGFEDAPATLEPALEEALGGFEDNTSNETATPVAAASKRPWKLSGNLTLSSSYNFNHSAPSPGQTDHRGLSRLRAKLNLELDWGITPDWQAHIAGYGWHDTIYSLRDRGNYSDELLDSMEDELTLGEAWVRGKLHPQLDLKLGRQIVVWGKSDNLRVADIINPLDMRELGLVDIEDLRLSLTMARLDYYWDDWNLSALVIPEIRFNRNPAFGSDFYPYPTPQPEETSLSNGGSNTEYALALNGIFSGWDLSLYAARLFDDLPHLENGLRKHSRLTMAGASTNIAMGNWLLKGELAHFRGLEYTPLPGEKKNRSDLMLGVEYSGLTDTTLSFEIVDRHIHTYDNLLATQGIEENEWQTALRYQGEFLHARLKLTALMILFGDPDKGGGSTRVQAAYELSDGLNLSGGIVHYDSGEKLPFNAIGDNDRLFLDLKYSF